MTGAVTNVHSPFTRQIHRAAQHPVELDLAQADAVEARILLDLRIGAAFTRMQTLSLSAQVQQLAEKLVSYGKPMNHQSSLDPY
jgi:DNA topoisomerase IA